MSDGDALWALLEHLRVSHEEGQPLIPLKEMIALRILRKLELKDCWGGEAKNKAYMWAEDLPKGGFPHGYCNRRQILDVAHRLMNAGVLTTKPSDGQIKYALATKPVVQPILDARSFESRDDLRRYFEKDAQLVPSRLLNDMWNDA
ncbi:MAG: hypothetical protein IT431_00905 [Phycisphaerales bacterium]|nr:hypothetical protein [Phycisphaerales bacterium]